MKLGLMTAMVWLAACSGPSDRERICEAANGCGALAAGNVSACVDILETIDADRAIAECADCLEAETCADIAGGACAPSCAQFASAFSGSPSGVPPTKTPAQLTPAEGETFCRYLVDSQGGPNVTENCGDFSVTTSTYAECEGDLATVACQVPVSDYELCIEMIDSPCDLFTTQACGAILQCGT